jgi:hypothetical protein
VQNCQIAIFPEQSGKIQTFVTVELPNFVNFSTTIIKLTCRVFQQVLQTIKILIMRYASSLLYGGMLVDAQNANYKDYSRLLLRCPFCGEPVFLVAGKYRPEHARLNPKTEQIVLVKEANVVPAFAHFPGVASEKCELRSRAIKQKDFSRAIARGRNQRLKFFQKRFWEIVSDGWEGEKFYTIPDTIKKANPFLPQSEVDKVAKDLIEDISKRFKDNLAEVKDWAGDLIAHAIENPNTAISYSNEEEKKIGISWLQSLEVDLHVQIVREALDFLCKKSASRLFVDALNIGLSQLIGLSGEQHVLKLLDLTSKKNMTELDRDYRRTVGEIGSGLISVLCGIRWAEVMRDKGR